MILHECWNKAILQDDDGVSRCMILLRTQADILWSTIILKLWHNPADKLSIIKLSTRDQASQNRIGNNFQLWLLIINGIAQMIM